MFQKAALYYTVYRFKYSEVPNIPPKNTFNPKCVHYGKW